MSTELTIPAENNYGPAMEVLTPRQQAFVIILLDAGRLNYTDAYLRAGYEVKDRHSAQVNGSRLAHDDRIIAAIKEESSKRLNAGSGVAINSIVVAAADPTHKDHIKACEMILNRTGFHALTEHKATVTHRSEPDEKRMKRISDAAKKLGLDPEKLLGSIINGSYTEVVPEEEDDLSDVLGTPDE